MFQEIKHSLKSQLFPMVNFCEEKLSSTCVANGQRVLLVYKYRNIWRIVNDWKNSLLAIRELTQPERQLNGR